MVVGCAVFDFDGTLVQSVEIKRRGFFAVTKGIPGAADALDDVLADPHSGDRHQVFAELVARLRARGMREVPAPQQLAAAYSRYCEEGIAICPEVPGAARSLEVLRDGGLRLYLHSRTPLNALQPLVRLRGLDRHFLQVFGAPQSRREAVYSVLERERLSPEQVLLVSDDGGDASLADEIGLQFVGVVLEGNRAPPEFSGRAVLANLAALPAMAGLAAVH